MITGKQDKISSVLYRLTFEMNKKNIYHSKWLCFIEKKILIVVFSLIIGKHNMCLKTVIWLKRLK